MEVLKEGGRSGTQGKHSRRARSLLVVSEVALATLALVGAGLFIKSFEKARSIYPGFDANNVVLARFYPAGTGADAEHMQRFSVRLRERLSSAPGVLGSAYADYAPLGSSAGPYNRVEIEGYTPSKGEQMNVNCYAVSPGYLDVLRTPILAGRDFTIADTGQAAPVMIVNETFAKRYFQGGEPIGRKVKAAGKWYTVVGLMRDSKYFSVAEAPRPHFFVPLLQRNNLGAQVYFFIRARSNPDAVIASLRGLVADVDPEALAFHAMHLRAWTEVTLLPHKMAASLLGGVGIVSLLLAAVGLYSVLAYTVSQRSQEIGIRIAMGARPSDVLRSVAGSALRMTLAGLAVGICGALVVTRLISGMLVQVSSSDPLTFTGASVFLILVALLATYLPARRAIKVDPIVVLRQ